MGLCLKYLERDRGIEPLSSVWKTEIITTIPIPQYLVHSPGFEPGT